MEINLIFHPGSSILAEKDSFCLKKRRFPTTVAFQTYCDLKFFFYLIKNSLVVQMVKNWPAIQETQVQPLGWEDPLEKGMATHSSIPAWRIPWTEEPCGLKSMGSQRVGHNWATNTFTFKGFTQW